MFLAETVTLGAEAVCDVSTVFLGTAVFTIGMRDAVITEKP